MVRPPLCPGVWYQGIHRTEKDGDLAHENPKTAHKNAQKRSENFKPCIHNVVSSGKISAKIWPLCAFWLR